MGYHPFGLVVGLKTRPLLFLHDMKDPAFLFYSSDFLNGVTDLTMEERGQFITMLCLQHQKGVLTEKTIRLSLGSVSVDVLSKFEKDSDGNLYNERLRNEIEKRMIFTESRRQNGSKGGRPKKIEKPNGLPYGLPKGNLMEDEIENEDKDNNKKKGVDFSIYPEPYQSGLKQWYDYKKERGQTYKKKGWDAAVKAILAKYTNPNDFNNAVLFSITNNYSGLFPDTTKTNNPKPTKKLDTMLNFENDPDYQ